MKQFFWAVLLIFGASACQSQVSDKNQDSAPKSPEQVTVQGNILDMDPTAFEQEMKNKPGTLVDVRTPGEYNDGHLDNALNIDYNGSGFDQQVDQLDKTKPVYVYCAVGGRSASAAKILSNKGFQVVNMSGGYKAWQIKH